MLPQQIFLLERLMTWPTSLSLEVEWRRRNEAVEAVRMYCDVREGGPCQGRQSPKRPAPAKEDIPMNDAPADISTADQSPSSPSGEALREVETHIQAAKKPLGCFQCYRNIDESNERRMKHYSHHKHLLRHFRDIHLDDRHCNYCNKTARRNKVFKREDVAATYSQEKEVSHALERVIKNSPWFP